jgi:ribosome-associated translation inhibitor RaiA
MDVEIQAQHTEVHPRWRELIERGAAKVREICSEVLRLHVTLVHSPHHLRGAEEVRLLANVPGETLTARKTAPDMGDAFYAAFKALEEELRAFVERRRERHRLPKRP